jgi:hypothetical protein
MQDGSLSVRDYDGRKQSKEIWQMQMTVLVILQDMQVNKKFYELLLYNNPQVRE